MAALLKGQKDIAAHDNCDVADDAVKIPQLGFPLKVEVVFQRLEEHFDVPPFAVDADNLLVGEVDPGRQDGQPLALVAVANEDDFHLLLLLRLDHRAGQDARPTGPLFQLVEYPAQGQPLPLVPVKHLGQVLAHADYRQEFAQGCKQSGKGEPAVHEQIVGPDAPLLDPFHHGFQVPGGLGHGLHPALVAAAAFVHLLGDALEPFARLGGRAQDEIERQEAHPVGPTEGEQPVLASKIRKNITVVLKTMYSQENLKMFNSTERGKSFVNDLTKTIMEVGVILQELEDNFSDFKNRKINKLNSILFEGALTPSAWSSVLGTDWSNFEYFGKYVSNEGSFVRMVSMLTELYGFKTERFKSKFMENVTSTVGERTQEIVGRDLTALLVPNPQFPR